MAADRQTTGAQHRGLLADLAAPADWWDGASRDLAHPGDRVL
jgi:hypothetical protein